MNILELEERAKKEIIDIKKYIDVINKKRKECPEGTDLSIPKIVIPNLMRYCDDNNIPFYHVTENCVSTAATYAHLVAYEKSR